jgi:hypothetical protein
METKAPDSDRNDSANSGLLQTAAPEVRLALPGREELLTDTQLAQRIERDLTNWSPSPQGNAGECKQWGNEPCVRPRCDCPDIAGVKERLDKLSSPAAESLSDYDRINSFCMVAAEALRVIEQMEGQLKHERGHVTQLDDMLSYEKELNAEAQARCEELEKEVQTWKERSCDTQLGKAIARNRVLVEALEKIAIQLKIETARAIARSALGRG